MANLGNSLLFKEIERIAKKVERARKYWKTFVVGDRIAIQTENARGFRLQKGVIAHINKDFMNVNVNESMFSFKFAELILIDRPLKIAHITQRRIPLE